MGPNGLFTLTDPIPILFLIFDVGSIGTYSNIVGIGHFIGIGQCECTVIYCTELFTLFQRET